jgi:K+-sensing histidine kinase KdpD
MELNKNDSYKKVFVFWIIILLVSTFTSAMIYVIAQQSLRLAANIAPSQLAVETSMNLDSGKAAAAAAPANKTDISKSLSPFVIIYDNNKNVVAASATVSGAQPNYPSAVLKSVTKDNQARVTWQPKEDLRFATVAVKSSNGYVVAGESLSETENIISTIGKLVLFSWLGFAVFSALALALLYQVITKA